LGLSSLVIVILYFVLQKITNNFDLSFLPGYLYLKFKVLNETHDKEFKFDFIKGFVYKFIVE
jgi:hypothetical protein